MSTHPPCTSEPIDKALGELKGKQALVYIDDVIIPSKTIEEGFQNLEKVLTALSSAGFRLNYQKCTFFTTETEYLGVVISAGTVRPNARKVAGLTQTTAPTSVKEQRQILGLAGYFRRFIKNFSMLIAPISALLKKHNAFEWSKDCESVKQLIIKKLTETPLLRIFNPNLEIELDTDASCIESLIVFQQKHTAMDVRNGNFHYNENEMTRTHSLLVPYLRTLLPKFVAETLNYCRCTYVLTR
jgi:hypothetical protein